MTSITIIPSGSTPYWKHTDHMFVWHIYKPRDTNWNHVMRKFVMRMSYRCLTIHVACCERGEEPLFDRPCELKTFLFPKAVMSSSMGRRYDDSASSMGVNAILLGPPGSGKGTQVKVSSVTKSPSNVQTWHMGDIMVILRLTPWQLYIGCIANVAVND